MRSASAALEVMHISTTQAPPNLNGSKTTSISGEEMMRNIVSSEWKSSLRPRIIFDGLVVHGKKSSSSCGEAVYRISVQLSGKLDQFWVENSSFYKVLRSIVTFDGASVDFVDETPNFGSCGQPYSAVREAIRQWELTERELISRNCI